MVDVIPHATTGARVPRIVRAALPAVVVAAVVFGVAAWGWWLHPGGALTPAIAAPNSGWVTLPMWVPGISARVASGRASTKA